MKIATVLAVGEGGADGSRREDRRDVLRYAVEVQITCSTNRPSMTMLA